MKIIVKPGKIFFPSTKGVNLYLDMVVIAIFPLGVGRVVHLKSPRMTGLQDSRMYNSVRQVQENAG